MSGAEWIRINLLNNNNDPKKVYNLYSEFKKATNSKSELDTFKRQIRRVSSLLSARNLKFVQKEVDHERFYDLKAEEHDMKIAEVVGGKYVDVAVDDVKPIGIVFTSDWHLENGLTDLTRLKEDMKLIAKTDGLYHMMSGDIIDNAIKHLGMMTNGQPPSQGLVLLEHILDIAGDSTLAIIGGNHDNWTKMKTSLPAVDSTINTRGISYRANQLVINLALDEETYQIALVHKHKFSSYLNPNHKIKRMWETFTTNFDIGCVGHDHVFGVEDFWRHSEKKIAIRPGTYERTSAFGEECGYHESQEHNAMVILYPDEHRMVSFTNMYDGIIHLEAVRR